MYGIDGGIDGGGIDGGSVGGGIGGGIDGGGIGVGLVGVDIDGGGIDGGIDEFYMAFSLFKVGAICQGILGRVRDGTASSKHAEDRGMKVYPLSEFAWSIVKNNF